MLDYFLVKREMGKDDFLQYLGEYRSESEIDIEENGFIFTWEEIVEQETALGHKKEDVEEILTYIKEVGEGYLEYKAYEK